MIWIKRNWSDDTVDVQGWQHPPSTHLHHIDNTHLVIKVPGHNCWMGNGFTEYVPTQFWVCEIQDSERTQDNAIRYKCKELVMFPLKKPPIVD